ncbi:hypothetical protein D7L35_10675 [Enterococcus faecalis]|nr:hypothetical protein [Enterococcus faecalis]
MVNKLCIITTFLIGYACLIFSDNTDKTSFSKRHLTIASERTSCSYATVSILKNQEELNVLNRRKCG